jgi:hypothetical protein
MSERNVKEFAVGSAAILSGGTLKLIGMVLEKHDAAIIEFCCEQQDKITALENELSEVKRQRDDLISDLVAAQQQKSGGE